MWASLALSTIHPTKRALARWVGGIEQTIIPWVAAVLAGNTACTRLAIRTTAIKNTLPCFQIAQFAVVALVVCSANAFSTVSNATTGREVGTAPSRFAVAITAAAISTLSSKTIANLVEGTLRVLCAAHLSVFGVTLAVTDTSIGHHITEFRPTQIVFNLYAVCIGAAPRKGLAPRCCVTKLTIATAAVIDTYASARFHVTGLVFPTIFMGMTQPIVQTTAFFATGAQHKQSQKRKEQNNRLHVLECSLYCISHGHSFSPNPEYRRKSNHLQVHRLCLRYRRLTGLDSRT